MENQNDALPNPLNPEVFKGHVVDIVHNESVQRVAEGKKPADISDRNQTKIVLERIKLLLKQEL